jgi:hypothetical protein
MGLFVSDADSNIFTSDTVAFKQAYTSLRIKNKILPATSLNIIDNQLFVGTESKLFLSSTPNKIKLHYEQTDKIIPLVRVNGVDQYIGYRFTTASNYLNRYVCFDVKLDVDAVVEFANDFQIYTVENKGWVEDNYIAAVTLYVDGEPLNTLSLAEKPASALESLVLPTYDDINAHAAQADIYATKFYAARNTLIAKNLTDTGGFVSFKAFDKTNVCAMFIYLNRFLSQIYEQVQDQFAMSDFKVLLLRKLDKDAAEYTEFNNKYGTLGTYLDYIAPLEKTAGSFGSEITDNKVDAKYLSDTTELSLGFTGGGSSVYGGILDADTSSDGSVTSTTGDSTSSGGSTSNGKGTVNPLPPGG